MKPHMFRVSFLLLPRRCRFPPKVSPASDKTVSMDSEGTASRLPEQISGVPIVGPKKDKQVMQGVKWGPL